MTDALRPRQRAKREQTATATARSAVASLTAAPDSPLFPRWCVRTDALCRCDADNPGLDDCQAAFLERVRCNTCGSLDLPARDGLDTCWSVCPWQAVMDHG